MLSAITSISTTAVDCQGYLRPQVYNNLALGIYGCNGGAVFNNVSDVRQACSRKCQRRLDYEI